MGEKKNTHRERLRAFVLLSIWVSLSPLFIFDPSTDKREKTETFTMNNDPWNIRGTEFRPTFTFCGDFSGMEGQISAARWLKRLEWELEPSRLSGDDFAKFFLKSVDLLLTEDAAKWADTSEEVSSLLSMAKPSSHDMTRFKDLFQARFPGKLFEPASTSFNFDTALHRLRQRMDEPLKDYYQRTMAMMHRVGASDRISGGRSLTILESAILDLIIKAFVHGLSDTDVYAKCSAKINTPRRSCSLYEIFNVAEEAKITKAKWPEEEWGLTPKSGAGGEQGAPAEEGGLAAQWESEPSGTKEAQQSDNDKYWILPDRTRDSTPSSVAQTFKNTPTSSLDTIALHASARAQQHREQQQREQQQREQQQEREYQQWLEPQQQRDQQQQPEQQYQREQQQLREHHLERVQQELREQQQQRQDASRVWFLDHAGGFFGSGRTIEDWRSGNFQDIYFS